MFRFYSPFRFYVCFPGKQSAVQFIVIEINEVQQAAEDGLSQMPLVIGFGQYIKNQVNIFLAVEFHGGACDGWVSILLKL